LRQKSAIRLRVLQVKEEMEEPKEAAVNKREGAAKFELSDEGKRALKMSDDKGRKVSKGGILIRSLLGGSSAGGRAQLEITDAAHGPIIAYSKLTPPLILASNSH
jgi:hypothetical protein